MAFRFDCKEMQGIYGTCGPFRPGNGSIALVLSSRHMVPAIAVYAPIYLIVFLRLKLCSEHPRLGESNLQAYTRRSLGYNCFHRVCDFSRMESSKGPGAGADGDDLNLSLWFGSNKPFDA